MTNDLESAPDHGMYVLTDSRGDNACLTIKYGRTGSGITTVDMVTPPRARQRPVRVTLNGATILQRNIPAATPCDCPEDAESVLGGVHVRHRDDCLHGEPRQYVWHYEGSLYTGTLATYAEFWQSLDPEAQHATTTKRPELRTWNGSAFDAFRLTVTGDMDNDFWFHYRLSVDDEWVTVDIDGRA